MEDLFIYYKGESEDIIDVLRKMGIYYSYGDSRLHSKYIFTNGEISILKSKVPDNIHEFKQGLNSYTYKRDTIYHLSTIEIIEITNPTLFVNLAVVLSYFKNNPNVINPYHWNTCITEGDFESKHYQPGDMIFCAHSLVKDSLLFKISSINEVLSQFGKTESDLIKITIQ
jgi:hypothetical protein